MRNLHRLIVVGFGLLAFGVQAICHGGQPAATSAAKPAGKKPVRVQMPPPPKLTDAQLQAMAKACRMSSDSVRLAIGFIYKYQPTTARTLMDQWKKDQKKFRSTISDVSYRARNLESLKRSDPARYARQRQIYSLEAQSQLLVDLYKSASEAEKPHVEVRLTDVLSKLFDLRLEEDRYQLEQLRKQVDATQARIDAKASNKNRIVDRELTRRLGIDEVLSW